ncbi:unnamed protein product [Moneuplotes crassus]|uniref:Uncharacterized protein n=1 Tax=Euplotes crassus TaxID=5936 RepID=A0AAD1U4R7_EUPCR|nr:unnamed protein product [Moneuplotes crassus]
MSPIPKKCPRHYKSPDPCMTREEIDLDEKDVRSISRKLANKLKRSRKKNTESLSKIAERSKLNFFTIAAKAAEKQRINSKLPKSMSRCSQTLQSLSKISKKIMKSRKNEVTHNIDEESFDLEQRALQSSVGFKGKHNPISNGKMNRILNQLIDEAIFDKKYRSKYQKLYARKLSRKFISAQREGLKAMHSKSRSMVKKRTPAFPFKFESPLSAGEQNGQNVNDSRRHGFLVPKILVSEDKKTDKKKDKTRGRKSILITQLQKSSALKIKSNLVLPSNTITESNADSLQVSKSTQKLLDKLEPSAAEKSMKKVQFKMSNDLESVLTESANESCLNSAFSEDPHFFDEITPTVSKINSKFQPKSDSKFKSIQTLSPDMRNIVNGRVSAQQLSPLDPLSIKKTQTVFVEKTNYFNRKPPKKKKPTEIYQKLEEKIKEFKFEYISPVKYEKPKDPFGFLNRQRILHQDVPQHEIMAHSDNIVEQAYTAPMLGKILEKYSGYSPDKKNLPPMNSVRSSPFSDTRLPSSPLEMPDRMAVSEQNFYKPNAEKAIAKDFKEKTRMDMFEKIFKRRSLEMMHKMSRLKGQKQQIDYFTRNNINKVLDDCI